MRPLGDVAVISLDSVRDFRSFASIVACAHEAKSVGSSGRAASSGRVRVMTPSASIEAVPDSFNATILSLYFSIVSARALTVWTAVFTAALKSSGSRYPWLARVSPSAL